MTSTKPFSRFLPPLAIDREGWWSRYLPSYPAQLLCTWLCLRWWGGNIPLDSLTAFAYVFAVGKLWALCYLKFLYFYLPQLDQVGFRMKQVRQAIFLPGSFPNLPSGSCAVRVHDVEWGRFSFKALSPNLWEIGRVNMLAVTYFVRWTSSPFFFSRSSWTLPSLRMRFWLELLPTRSSSLTACWVWSPTSSLSLITTKVLGTCTSARWVRGSGEWCIHTWEKRCWSGYIDMWVCFIFMLCIGLHWAEPPWLIYSFPDDECFIVPSFMYDLYNQGEKRC